jgi:hypothetical protein
MEGEQRRRRGAWKGRNAVGGIPQPTLEKGRSSAFLAFVFTLLSPARRPCTRLVSLFVGFLSAFVWSGAVPASASDAPPEIMPLSEIQRGQEGVWRTVIAGDEVEEFPLRILGVIPNFIGPRLPAIIAEAVDPENVLSGPVAGMSGSPVYIDGKLVGAYAYGYVWPKEQAIIGITPIEHMLAIRDLPRTETGVWEGARMASTADGDARRPETLVDSAAVLRPLPTPLSLGGFSAATMETFRSEWETLGLTPVLSGGGNAASFGADVSEEGPGIDLRPGAAVAGVLMSGDFSAAATGTITYVDGDELLAFGHPFLQEGAVAMPMAGAEILTVVRNLRSSFKLSRTGALDGTLLQDRIMGVAGKVGELPPMIPLSLSVDWPGAERDFRAQIWPHPSYFPLLAGMAVQQGLGESQFREDRETVLIEGEVHLGNGDILPMNDAATGPHSAGNMGLALMQRLRAIADNPFGPVEIESIELRVSVREGWAQTSLREVRVGDARPRAGNIFPLRLRLQEYQGESREIAVEIPLPADRRKGEEFTVYIADASFANRLLNRNQRSVTADTVEEWLEPFREVYPSNALYVFLVEDRAVAEIDGNALPALPPSISSALGDDATHFLSSRAAPRVLFQEAIPVEGVFSGSDQVKVTIE